MIRSFVAAALVALVLPPLVPGRALAQDATQPTSNADVLFERGARALRQGDVPEALELLARALREDPNDASVLSAYAQALIAADRADEAEAIIRDAAGPGKTVDEDLALGVVRYQLHQYPEAVSHLERAVERQPRSGAARLFLAAALIETGELDRAEQELANAERLDPGLRAEVAFRRGRIALDRGDRSSAQRFFEDVQSIAPGSPLARAASQAIGLSGTDPRPWGFYATFGGGYDTNVNLAGQDPLLSTSRDGDWLGFVELGAHWDVVSTDRFNLKVGMTSYLERHQDERDFDLSVNRAWGVAALKLTDDLTFDTRYTFEYILTNFRQFRKVNAAEPSLRWRAREDLLTRVFFRYEHRTYFTPTGAFPSVVLPPDFRSSASDDPLDRDGRLLVPGVEQYWFFPDFTGWGRGFVRLHYRHRDEATDGTESDASGHIGAVLVGLPLPAKVFLLLEGEYEWRNFDHVSVIGLIGRGEFDRRKERIRRARVILRRPITDRITAEIAWRFTKWTSNVDFYEFSRHIGTFLVTYRY